MDRIDLKIKEKKKEPINLGEVVVRALAPDAAMLLPLVLSKCGAPTSSRRLL